MVGFGSEGAFGLAQSVLSNSHKRYGKSPAELYDDVINDYGSCNWRRFWRILRRLLSGGALLRRITYVERFNRNRALYFFVHDDVGIIKMTHTFSCDICGMIGPKSRTHNTGHSWYLANHQGPPKFLDMGGGPHDNH